MKVTVNKLLTADIKYFGELLAGRHYGTNPLGTWLMNMQERYRAERLVKLGLVQKGHAIENERCVIYYIDFDQMQSSQYYKDILAVYPDI